jgi:hypothetical protein
VARARHYAARHNWFLKLDIRKYFDSVDHEVLKGLLARKFKDAGVLDLFGQILASYQTAPGRGLPIGNLTSQHFANYYLAPLDRFIKERLGRRAYVRYMDDFVVWGDTAAELQAVRRAVEEFLRRELKLQLKSNVVLNRTRHGMDFLGYRLRPGALRLARRSKVRFGRKFRHYERAYLRGQWSEGHLQQRMQALVAFTLPAHSRACRQGVIERFGVAAFRLEPRQTRRQLEQQREELPDGEPQQRQPDQPEQQPRVPVRPASSSTRTPEGVGADPAAIPSCEGARAQAKTESPPGVGSPAGLLDRTLRAGAFY